MAGWDAERVWEAFDAWRWVPPSAVRVEAPDYDLVVTPGTSNLSFVYGFRVEGLEKAGARLNEVKEKVLSLGGTGVSIAVTPRTAPVGLPKRLEAHGYRLAEETELLACELVGGRLPEFRPAQGVSVREAGDDAEYESFIEMDSTVFGEPAPSAETRKVFLSEFHETLARNGRSDRYVAWEGGRAVGRGGMDLDGPVARLWAGGVLAEWRGRGVYGALVRARCESAAARGAEVAIVTARVGTSGPILKRHGFKSFGTVLVYEARWDAPKAGGPSAPGAPKSSSSS